MSYANDLQIARVYYSHRHGLVYELLALMPPFLIQHDLEMVAYWLIRATPALYAYYLSDWQTWKQAVGQSLIHEGRAHSTIETVKVALERMDEAET